MIREITGRSTNDDARTDRQDTDIHNSKRITLTRGMVHKTACDTGLLQESDIARKRFSRGED